MSGIELLHTAGLKMEGEFVLVADSHHDALIRDNVITAWLRGVMVG